MANITKISKSQTHYDTFFHITYQFIHIVDNTLQYSY